MTMLTIGFGNVYPITYIGKFISGLSSFFGYCLFSIVIICLSDFVDLKG